MSLTNPNTPVSQQDLQDFYHKILPYMGGSFEMLANKFSKGDLYSTEERMIGQWVDGKPLYQKAIEFSFSQSETTKTIDSTLTRSYIEDIVGFNGGYTQSDGNKMAIPRVPLSQFNGLTAYVDASGLIIARTSNTPIGSGFINVQYTKITDSPISIGNDTDYSTEEKIIGTWIDGKPLWQKTFVLTNNLYISSKSWENVIAIDTPIDAIITNTIIRIAGGTVATTNYSAEAYYRYNEGYLQYYCIVNSLTLEAGSTITIQYTKTT